MSSSAEASANIDASSISPTHAPLERRDSLEKHLTQRPDAQDLKNRNILLDTSAAPALQAKQHDLERQKVTDSLKKGLEHRSDREALIERNILPESTAAPALQGHQRELERHMRADSLEKQLQQRLSPGELVKEGILEADENPLKDD